MKRDLLEYIIAFIIGGACAFAALTYIIHAIHAGSPIFDNMSFGDYIGAGVLVVVALLLIAIFLGV